jgi:hypothetical protein
MRGDPDDARRYDAATKVGPWGGPTAGLTLACELPRRLLVDLSVEAGYALLATRGTLTGGEALTARGLFWGAQVALGWGR